MPCHLCDACAPTCGLTSPRSLRDHQVHGGAQVHEEQQPGAQPLRLHNEQFVGAVNYETNITARSGEPIHFEVGQYLWLGVWTETKPDSPSFPYTTI